MMMSKEEFLNSKPVMDTYKEILEFYIQKNEENNLGISQNELEQLALSRAHAEIYVQYCHDGIMEKPAKCTECLCGIDDKEIEEYLTCSMAPAYVVHQPNLNLSEKRPSWCPMNEHDVIQDAIQMYLSKQNGPVQ